MMSLKARWVEIAKGVKKTLKHRRPARVVKSIVAKKASTAAIAMIDNADATKTIEALKIKENTRKDIRGKMLSNEDIAMNVDVKGYASKDARVYVTAGLPYSFSNQLKLRLTTVALLSKYVVRSRCVSSSFSTYVLGIVTLLILEGGEE